MNIEKFEKQEIGARQLEMALRIFFAEGDLFSVITLAGAAEEIFGQLLLQRESQGRSPLRSVLDLLRPGKGAGAAGKGWSAHETDLFIHMDARQEALFLLGRAVDDYRALTGAVSPAMQRFNEEFRGGKG